jgi:hypothetical protein
MRHFKWGIEFTSLQDVGPRTSGVLTAALLGESIGSQHRFCVLTRTSRQLSNATSECGRPPARLGSVATDGSEPDAFWSELHQSVSPFAG